VPWLFGCWLRKAGIRGVQGAFAYHRLKKKDIEEMGSENVAY
jgi:hypothetical protein